MSPEESDLGKQQHGSQSLAAILPSSLSSLEIIKLLDFSVSKIDAGLSGKLSDKSQ